MPDDSFKIAESRQAPAMSPSRAFVSAEPNQSCAVLTCKASSYRKAKLSCKSSYFTFWQGKLQATLAEDLTNCSSKPCGHILSLGDDQKLEEGQLLVL